MFRLFTLRRKICASIIICSIDNCVESIIPPRNCNDRNVNNYIDRNTLMSKRIEENRSKTPLPRTDNDYQETSIFNESHKKAYNGIVPPGFPDNNIKLNPASSTPRPRSLNPSAITFYLDNLPSQNQNTNTVHIDYVPFKFNIDNIKYFFETNDNNVEILSRFNYVDCASNSHNYFNNETENDNVNVNIDKHNKKKVHKKHRKWINDTNVNENDMLDITIVSQNVQGLKDMSKIEKNDRHNELQGSICCIVTRNMACRKLYKGDKWLCVHAPWKKKQLQIAEKEVW